MSVPLPDDPVRARAHLQRAISMFWYDGAGPSHEAVTRVCDLVGKNGDDFSGSKRKRVETLVAGATDEELPKVATLLVDLLQGDGMIAGPDADPVLNAGLGKALRPYGLGLSPSGEIVGGADLGVDPSNLLDLPALREHIVRIQRAVQTDDAEQLLGSAKELLESTSKFVLEQQGLPTPDKFPALLSGALTALKLNAKQVAGDYDEVNDQVRRILGGLTQIGLAVNDLRNNFGTGHGVGTERVRLGLRHAKLAARSAMVLASTMIDTFEDPTAPWRRIASADVDQLIADLEGGLWSKGTLAQRLGSLVLDHLIAPDQQRIGIAVGRRCVNATGVVIEDGLKACADSADLSLWPRSYRTGLVAGLFLDRGGRIDTTGQVAVFAVHLLAPISDGEDLLSSFVAQTVGQRFSVEFAADANRRRDAGGALNAAAMALPSGGTRRCWAQLSERLVEGVGA